MRPVKGQFLRLREPFGDDLTEHVLRTPDVYIVPRHGGELFCGASSEEVGYDQTTTGGAVMDLLQHAFRALPGVYECEVLETGHGFRPATRDNLPVIGEVEETGIIMNTGHFRHGVMLAPISAQLAVSAVLGEDVPDYATAFSAARYFGEGVGERRDD